jgi:hypothetical protein
VRRTFPDELTEASQSLSYNTVLFCTLRGYEIAICDAAGIVQTYHADSVVVIVAAESVFKSAINYRL